MRGDIVDAVFEMNPLCSSRLLLDRHAHPPFPRGPDRPRNESASAVRTDVCKFALDTVGAERALVTANARFLGGGREVPVAILAIRSKLQRHDFVPTRYNDRKSSARFE